MPSEQVFVLLVKGNEIFNFKFEGPGQSCVLEGRLYCVAFPGRAITKLSDSDTASGTQLRPAASSLEGLRVTGLTSQEPLWIQISYTT